MVQLIKRDIFEEITAHSKEKEVTVITGARQTGKTTLLLQLKDWLIEQKNISLSQIKFFNLDIFSDLEEIKDQANFIKFLKEELAKDKFLYVFIDEIQRIENPGKFIKGIYDLNLLIKFIITGSSSLELKSKVFESLTGRKMVFHLWPISFNEYLSYHDPRLLKLQIEKDISLINKRKILNHFYDFAIYGGYPRVVLSESKEDKIKILNEIYSSYIDKDIIGFMNIKHPLTFSKLVTLLGSQIGGLVNLKEISNTVGINFRTVENYLSGLENTYVIKLVRPYFTNVRKELTKMPKIYFIDNGLRNFSIKYFAEFLTNRDKGQLLENIVYTALIKSWDGGINYWRTKDNSEVDFILTDYYGNIIPLEVKAAELKKPEIGRGLRSFIEVYKPKVAMVINSSYEGELKINKTSVKYLLPFREFAI